MTLIDLSLKKTCDHFQGFRGKFINSEKSTIIFWEAEAGAIVPEHSHPHEQISEVTEGKFELKVGNKTTILKSGLVIIIPPNTTHSGKALTSCKIKDIFCPVREDYKEFS
ncbi:MAG: hypothetical protein A3B68_09620 [Candidatus Melainabacteria bacterium RIFCSPHIGHO2_02_FULL_34_12]|nr:MAG: hypothetical protein A3B68_09620 [Candidatus Melainabacteria bacterium RIFCSPHIGHO2_02_FULL_34_12]